MTLLAASGGFIALPEVQRWKKKNVEKFTMIDGEISQLGSRMTYDVFTGVGP